MRARAFMRAAAAAVLAGTLLAGPAVAQAPSPEAVPSPANNPPSRWPAPQRFGPDRTTASPGEVVTSMVAGIGMVQATRQTMSRIGQTLPIAAGRNRAVEPCRMAVWQEGAKLGARDVEAASAGPERSDKAGRVTAPVLMRITYAVGMGYEVREAVMSCTVDRKGNLVDATAVEGGTSAPGPS